MKLPKFRSKFEKDTYDFLKKKKVKFEYEPREKKIRYVKPSTNHWYLPDFVITTLSGKLVYVETKGIWTATDRLKHLILKKTYGRDRDIRFVFYNSKQKIRKGSKTTYADICKGLGRSPFKGVKWKYSDKIIPQEWLDE